MNDVPCFIFGCDYHVPGGDAWAEEMEQHIRWVHIPDRKFGEKPVPSLSAMLVGGIIRPDEFALFTRDAIQVEMDKLDPPMPPERIRRALTLFLFGAGGATLALVGNFTAIFIPKPYEGFALGLSSAGVFFCFLMLLRMFGLFPAPLIASSSTVRIELYPDTSNVDADDGEGGA